MTMASSYVARIPIVSFRDRIPQHCVVFSCGGRGGFGAGDDDTASSGKQPSPLASPCSSCSDASSSVVDNSSSSCSGRRVLDRWAAHQAREMVTTVERQAHEAELSALSAASEPVSARAATFLHRESASAAPSTPRPSVFSPGGCSGVDDLPRNTRASSLIQMWRELEADAGIVPSPRACSSGGGGGNSALECTGSGFSSLEEACGFSEACDDSEWGLELTGQSKRQCGLADGEREPVGDVVKRLSSVSETQSSSICITQGNEPFAYERSLNAESVLLKGAARLRGRRQIDGLLARRKLERQQELGRLMDRCAVSKFSYRSRIQSLLRFRGPHRLLMVQHQELHDSTALELDSLRQRGSTIWFLRERFCSSHQQGNNVGQVADDKDMHIILQDNSLGSNNMIIADQPTNRSPQVQDVAIANDSRTIIEENLSQTTNECLQEDSQSSTSAWQENNLQISNIDWQRAIDASNLDSWEGELATEESDFDSQNIVEDASATWSNGVSHMHVEWENHRHTIYHELDGNYPDSVEIQELLQRKPVSTSLASNFRETMDSLVLSLLQRQQSMIRSIEEEEEEEEEDEEEEVEVQPVQRHGDGFGYADQAASSLSTMPLMCQTFQSPDSQQGSCMTYRSSHQLLETELINDLRTDIAEIHHEMGELRKMIETCIHGQSKLQNLIREDVSSMVCNSVGIAALLHSPKWALTKKGNCCVCYETQIDSLLYRCGHMCTCYKCAQELQWGAGRCPICGAPILDVVRAYSET